MAGKHPNRFNFIRGFHKNGQSCTRKAVRGIRSMLLRVILLATVLYSLLGASAALESDVAAGRLMLSSVSHAKSEAEVLDTAELMPADAVIGFESRRRGTLSEKADKTAFGRQARFLGASLSHGWLAIAFIGAGFLGLLLLSVSADHRRIVSYIHAQDGAK